MAPRRITDNFQNNYTIVLYKGVTYNKSFTYTDSSDVPIDLTGKSVSIHFKNVFDDDLELNSDDAPTALGSFITITDEVGGAFTLQLSKEETATATKGPGTWWLELHTGNMIEMLWTPDEVTVIEL